MPCCLMCFSDDPIEGDDKALRPNQFQMSLKDGCCQHQPWYHVNSHGDRTCIYMFVCLCIHFNFIHILIPCVWSVCSPSQCFHRNSHSSPCSIHPSCVIKYTVPVHRCLLTYFCAPCSTYYTRYRVLDGDMSKYVCCQG